MLASGEHFCAAMRSAKKEKKKRKIDSLVSNSFHPSLFFFFPSGNPFCPILSRVSHASFTRETEEREIHDGLV